MTLSGLRALNALKAFKNANYVLIFKRIMAISMHDIMTTKQSILFHPDAIYGSILMNG
jgi:hypothetical protein